MRLALLAALLAAQDPKQAGEIFRSEVGGFEAWFPSPPAYERQPDKSGPRWDSHKHRVETERMSLMVTYYEAPEVRDVDDFSRAIKKAYAGLKWKFQKEAKLTLGEHKGLSMTFLDPEGTVIQNRFYFVKERRYHLTATTLAKVSPTQPDVVKFLGSFKLLDEKK